MLRKFFLFLLPLLLCNPALADDHHLSEQFWLANGMQVIVIPNHRVPAVTHMVWYKAGAIDEPEGKSGIAHYLEHLMFKGTVKIKAGEFSKNVSLSGGTDNAFTSYDYTAYFQVVSKDDLEMVMEMEADRMMNLNVDPKEAENELQVVLEERRTDIENNPSSFLREQLRSLLFPGSRYGIPVIGKKEEVEKLTLDDAMDFYHSHYTPNDAILVVSGDVSVEEVKSLAEKYYGGLPQRKLDGRRLAAIAPVKKNFLAYSDDKVQQEEWIRYYRAPSIETDHSEMAIPLLLLSHILGESDTGRLYTSLVVEKKLASSVNTSYDETSLLDSRFGVFVNPLPGSNKATIERLVNSELDKITKEGLSPEELQSAKNYLKANAIYARDGVKGMAFIFGQAAVIGLGPDYIENWENNVDAVTNEQIMAAASFVFREDNSVTGALLP